MLITVVPMKLPLEQIEKAVKIVRATHDALIDLEHERKALGSVERVKQREGEQGVQRHAAALADIDRRWAQTVADAQAAIDEQARAAVNAIDEQTTPNGNDIIGANAADFALVEHGLIANPSQLSRILARHNNTAFRLAAQNYAAVRAWEGFDFFSKEVSVRAYTEQVFDNLKIAAGNPNGVAYRQYCETPNEYGRIANSYGLADEYSASMEGV